MTPREAQVRQALARPTFERGEVVRFVPDEPTSVSQLKIHDEKYGGTCEYVVVEVAPRGNWYAVACLTHPTRDGGSLRRFPRAGTGFGGSYFRIAGACRGHRPTYRHNPDDAFGERDPTWIGWFCARCDAVLPEACSSYHLRPQA